MTIDFKSKGNSIVKFNSTISKELISNSLHFWADTCDAIFVSTSDKGDNVQKAKEKLMKIAQAQKFEQVEPTEVPSKFDGNRVFVMNRVPLESVDDNSDYAMELLLGN